MSELPEIAALAKQARDGLDADEQMVQAYVVEAVAEHGPRRCTPGRWSAYLEGGDDGWAFEDAIGCSAGAIIGPKAMTEHIARHDPHRVLADVAARRTLLDEALAWGHQREDDDWYSCAQARDEDGEWACSNDARAGAPCDCGRDERVRAVLTALAAPYQEAGES
jgi:hypothetical protein